MKVCSKCKLNKDDSNFHKRNGSKIGLASRCKDCRKIDIKSNSRKAYSRNYDLVKSYGITSEDYTYILKAQEFKCAICKIHIDELKGNYKEHLCVDHCHETNVVRGLLCDSCNRGIGLLKDDVEILINAVKYLNGKFTNFKIK